MRSQGDGRLGREDGKGKESPGHPSPVPGPVTIGHLAGRPAVATQEMASPSRQDPLGGSGLLQGSRARSYGSLVQSACSPVRERRLEHQLAPGDTLAGLALRYGVTVSLPGLGLDDRLQEMYLLPRAMEWPF